MAVRIITDTSCDLPGEYLDQYNIEMIPLKITFEDGKTYLDRVEIKPALFVEKMSSSKTLPKTSAPDPETFVTCFKKGLEEAGQVLFVSLSSGLSSTFQTAVLASKIIGGENIFVFDSLTASLGTGIAAIKAARMAARGLTADVIVEQLTEMRKTREVLFTLDTLENLVKGGRLNKLQGTAATILSIKPILRGNVEGMPEIVEKVRGRKHAVNRLVSLLGELAGKRMSHEIIGVSHVNCPQDAVHLAELIKDEYQPQEKVIIADMGATIGIYAGIGGLMINVY